MKIKERTLVLSTLLIRYIARYSWSQVTVSCISISPLYLQTHTRCNNTLSYDAICFSRLLCLFYLSSLIVLELLTNNTVWMWFDSSAHTHNRQRERRMGQQLVSYCRSNFLSSGSEMCKWLAVKWMTWKRSQLATITKTNAKAKLLSNKVYMWITVVLPYPVTFGQLCKYLHLHSPSHFHFHLHLQLHCVARICAHSHSRRIMLILIAPIHHNYENAWNIFYDALNV